MHILKPIKQRVEVLFDRAVIVSNLDKLEVLEQSLRLFLAWYGDNPDYPARPQTKMGSGEGMKPVVPDRVLSEAWKLLSNSEKGFTLDELVSAVYGHQVVVWEPKQIKNRFAKLLRAAGYTSRQRRQDDKRILAWGLSPELQQEILSTQMPF